MQLPFDPAEFCITAGITHICAATAPTWTV